MHICKSDLQIRASLYLEALPQALNSSWKKSLVQSFLKPSSVGSTSKSVFINDTQALIKKQLRQNLFSDCFYSLKLNAHKIHLIREYFNINISSLQEVISSYGNTAPLALASVSDSLLQ